MSNCRHCDEIRSLLRPAEEVRPPIAGVPQFCQGALLLPDEEDWRTRFPIAEIMVCDCPCHDAWKFAGYGMGAST